MQHDITPLLGQQQGSVTPSGAVPFLQARRLRLAATAMLKAGIQPKVAAGRLGHSSTQLFDDTYAHPLEELDDGTMRRPSGRPP